MNAKKNGDPSPNTATQAVRAGLSRERLWNRIVFAMVLVWTFLGLCFPLHDTDFWWHLKTGEWMLENGQFPCVDLYTFTDADKPWIDLHWGFQLLIALLHRLGGVPLVTLAKAGTITGAVAVGWLAGGSNLPNWKKAAIWLLAIICIMGRGNERPEMLTLLFLAMWLWMATHADRFPTWIWWCPLLQLVWVNCHALFVLGLVTGLCYTVDAIARELAGGRYGLMPRDRDAPSFREIWIVAGLVTVACLINPYFEEGALFPLTLYRKLSVEKEFYSQNIGEFKPPIAFMMHRGPSHFYGLTNIYMAAEVGMLVVCGFSFVWLIIRRRQWSLFRCLMFAGFTHLAWQMSRNTNIFALVCGVVACENFSDAMIPVENRSTANFVVRGAQRMAAVFALLMILVVTGVWNEIGEKNKPFGLGELPNWFIHDAAKFAAQPGFPQRAFIANIGQAEVYVYHNGPEKRVFMDARLEVCTQHTFNAFNRILDAMAQGNPAWQDVFADQEMPVVILDSRTSRVPITGMLVTPNWRLVFADRTAAVFLPVKLADELKLPMADLTPLMYPDGPPKKKKR